MAPLILTAADLAQDESFGLLGKDHPELSAREPESEIVHRWKPGNGDDLRFHCNGIRKDTAFLVRIGRAGGSGPRVELYFVLLVRIRSQS